MYPFKEGSFAVKNGWYVAGFANELVLGQPLARTFLGMPVALYRKSDGTAVAVGGRCPHRNFPLGKGCVKGDSIVCGYHGFAFGPDGQCTEVPSQGFAPKSFRIPTYPLVEHGIWLWIWPGDPELADESLLPDLAEIGVGAEGMDQAGIFSFEVKSRYQLLNDNLLDLTHIGFLHGTSIGVPEIASVPEEVTNDDRVMISRRYLKGAPLGPDVQKMLNYEGLQDSMVGMDFYLPGFHVGPTEMCYSSDNPEKEGQTLFRGNVYHAVTPATYNTSYYWFAVSHMGKVDIEGTRQQLDHVLAEDIFAAEEIEKMIGLVGNDATELMIKTDKNAVIARRMLQAQMDREAAETAVAA
jgi:vanillate O-demethylase monooxygenase subunit